MRKVFAFEMDVMAIMLKLNMLKATEVPLHDLYPTFGDLYPFVHDLFDQALDYDSVLNSLNDFPEYKEVLEKASSGEKGLLELFKIKKVTLLEECIKTCFSLGCIYAYVQLREQENENVVLLVQGNMMNRQDQVRMLIK